MFDTVGFESDAALYSAVITGAVNVASTVVSIYSVDKLGRRMLLLEAGIQMFLSQTMVAVILGIKVKDHSSNLGHGYAIFVVILVCTFVSAFAWSWGPLGWLIPSETFPLETRSAGQSVTVYIIKQMYISNPFFFQILTLWYRAPEVLLGATHYSPAVDIWSVACIFAELVTTQPLFAGDSELQQLLHIFRFLGTPNEEVWPGVSKLVNWHEYPQWSPKPLTSLMHDDLDEDGLNLLSEMLHYEPAKRISAKKALEHPYFDDLDKSHL